MISIVCCYNNETVYNQMLKKSIENQNVQCELIGVNNLRNKFSSAASALNYGARIAKGDYLVFAHQDLELYGENFIKSVVDYINKNECIVGLAGKRDLNGVHTNIRHVNKNQYAGKYRVQNPFEVQTLDECLIAMRREVYELLKFDEITCNDWHLYGVDFCLSAKKRNIKSIVVPLEAFHASSGILSSGYWKTMDRVVQKHRKDYTKIITTCSNVETGYLKYNSFKLLLKLKRNIKKLIS